VRDVSRPDRVVNAEMTTHRGLSKGAFATDGFPPLRSDVMQRLPFEQE
jgi:hypothetical protein